MNQQEHHDLLLREIMLLHQKVDALSRTPLPLRHAWVKHILHDFEYNPVTQYKVHLAAMWVWTVSIVTVVCLFAFANRFWQIVSVLYLVCISLYANWATDYGAMSAALAAQQLPPLPEVPLETHLEATEGGYE
jgi:Na+/phosphate symporter